MTRDKHVIGTPDWFVPASERRIGVDLHAYQRGLARGFWTAAALYTLFSVVLVLAFHALGMHS